MNTKSLLTRIAVPVLSLGLLGGLGAALATSAGASTLPAATMASVTTTLPFHQASGVTYLANRTTPASAPSTAATALYGLTLELLSSCSPGGGTYTYTATIRDFGQFHAVLGDDTPNQSGQYLNELISNPATSLVTGYASYTFTANSLPALAGHGSWPSGLHRRRRRLDRRLV